MATHGPLHDEFHAHSGAPHGGAMYDEGFGLQATVDTHGALHDRFGVKPGRVGKHGDRWDEFGWTDMPAKHGQLFDSDFAQPAALGNGEHGTWHDVFRGAQVRYLYDGREYEGVVLETHGTHAICEPRYGRNQGGNRHEVGLGQFTQLRDATEHGNPHVGDVPTAQPGTTQDTAPRSTAEAPSAHSATASGGHLPVAGGSKSQPGGTTSTVANKAEPDDTDVTKAASGSPAFKVPGSHHGPFCMGCAKQHAKSIGAPTIHPAEPRHATASCPGCGTRIRAHGSIPVHKSVDASETATQARDEGDNTGKAYCPNCEHYCRKTEDGNCPTCGKPVKGAEKAHRSDADVLKELRDLAEVAA